MKNSLLNRFVPKESKFFPLLNQLSQTVLNASEKRRPDNPADFHGARPDLYHPL